MSRSLLGLLGVRLDEQFSYPEGQDGVGKQRDGSLLL